MFSRDSRSRSRCLPRSCRQPRRHGRRPERGARPACASAATHPGNVVAAAAIAAAAACPAAAIAARHPSRPAAAMARPGQPGRSPASPWSTTGWRRRRRRPRALLPGQPDRERRPGRGWPQSCRWRPRPCRAGGAGRCSSAACDEIARAASRSSSSARPAPASYRCSQARDVRTRQGRVALADAVGRCRRARPTTDRRAQSSSRRSFRCLARGSRQLPHR